MKKQTEIKTEDDIKKLMKNINLIRLVEKIESKKNVLSQSFFVDKNGIYEQTKGDISVISNTSMNMSNINKYSNTNMGNNVNINVNANVNVSNTKYEQKCKKHGLLIHSYAIGTNYTLCDKCIADSNVKYHPLPFIVQDMRRKIDSNETRINLIKNEIERLKEFFMSYQ